MQVSMKFDKRFFFDRKAVENIIGKKAAKALAKAGAFVQRSSRSSLRRAGKKARAANTRVPSPPGKPPRVWATGSVATLKNIQFQFMPSTRSVFVGPLKLNGGGEAVPGLHERGGTSRGLKWRFDPHWFRTSKYNWRGNRIENKWRDGTMGQVNKRRALGDKIETKTSAAKYPERPFMGPALSKEAPKFPTLFARSA